MNAISKEQRYFYQYSKHVKKKTAHTLTFINNKVGLPNLKQIQLKRVNKYIQSWSRAIHIVRIKERRKNKIWFSLQHCCTEREIKHTKISHYKNYLWLCERICSIRESIKKTRIGTIYNDFDKNLVCLSDMLNTFNRLNRQLLCVFQDIKIITRDWMNEWTEDEKTQIAKTLNS